MNFTLNLTVVFIFIITFKLIVLFVDSRKLKDRLNIELEQKKAELKAMKMNSDAIISVLTVASCNNLDILDSLVGHNPDVVVRNSETGLSSYEGTIKDSHRKIQYNYYIEELSVEE